MCLLVAMLTASILNIYYLKGITDEVSQLVSDCAEASLEDDWKLAEVCAVQAKNKWEHCDGYTHIVLRHSEIDTVSDALYDLMSGIYDRSPADAQAGAEKVLYHIDSIYKMEQIRFGSIF